MILTMERAIIDKPNKKKTMVPRNAARFACLVTGSVLAVMKKVNTTINIRSATFPHLNKIDLFGSSGEDILDVMFLLNIVLIL